MGAAYGSGVASVMALPLSEQLDTVRVWGGAYIVRGLSAVVRIILAMVAESVTSATAEANARIRAFMVARAGRALWPEEQAEYEQLLAAWSNSTHPQPTPN
ncbi:hypothetical protein P354_07320 [Streptomyces noursei PD-1]|uniref:Uncharacterized protein n=2 Tax=Streptomyces noursei TaxID=1971 RepID=A0A401QPS7_STRNR|nr:hypothetical protein K530_36553 [Streptomyces noursei CCRC 11814]EXU91147.1 hypothetical protein P354_07320 [Streptomyces noursei PD-1]GCB87365.1 hypothetical protein SALB_00016 [Streptomyces noursei]